MLAEQLFCVRDLAVVEPLGDKRVKDPYYRSAIIRRLTSGDIAAA
jgi:hypothetical protein